MSGADDDEPSYFPDLLQEFKACGAEDQQFMLRSLAESTENYYTVVQALLPDYSVGVQAEARKAYDRMRGQELAREWAESANDSGSDVYVIPMVEAADRIALGLVDRPAPSIGGLLYTGRVNLLYGSYTAGKTWLVLHLAHLNAESGERRPAHHHRPRGPLRAAPARAGLLDAPAGSHRRRRPEDHRAGCGLVGSAPRGGGLQPVGAGAAPVLPVGGGTGAVARAARLVPRTPRGTDMSKKITWTDESGKTYVARERRVRRKTLVGVVVGALVLAVAGTAFALYLMRAGVDGSLDGRSLAVQWTSVQQGGTANGVNVTTAGTAVPGAGSAAVCTAARSSDGKKITLDVQGYPGDTCTVFAKMLTTGSESARVTGLNMTLPSGWKARLEPDATCGATVGGTPVAVGIVITVGPSGASGALAAADGVTLSPLSQTQGQTINCPELVGP